MPLLATALDWIDSRLAQDMDEADAVQLAKDRYGIPVAVLREERARRPRIEYDTRLGLATFYGPGGFTQQMMSQDNASAAAYALGIPFKLSRVGIS